MTGENIVRNENMENVSHSLLTYKNEMIICRFLTKQMVRILLLLLNGTMTNKEIAGQMQLTSSALSNILLRMKKCEIDLITSEKKEKYVLYTLTPIAREYVVKNLIVRGKSDLKVVQINERMTAEYIDCQNALSILKEKWGDEWEAEFLDSCSQYFKYRNKETVIGEAVAFFERMEELIVKGQTTQLEWILDELESETSKNKCLGYVRKYTYIRILCDLDAEDWERAYQFVEDAMDGDEICFSYDFLINCHLSKEDILGMADGLMYIIDCSKRMRLSKKEFLNQWSKYFFQHEKLLYIIGEKYKLKYC